MRVLKYLFLLGLAGGVLGAGALAAAVWHFSQDLPSTDGLRDLRLQVPLRIFTADGALIGEYGAERREPLSYEDIPPQLVSAFLAAEDDRFFEHPGVDYQGLLRAAWVLLLTGEKAQGGSTITMQLARNFFLSSEKSYLRKFREILLALQMERKLSKEEILTFYVNKIFLGHRAYGVGAAAKVYYDAEIQDLDLAQLAMIAGLPKAPSRYNPISGPQRALLRRNYVLRRMRELDYITQAEYDVALAEPVTARLRDAPIDIEAHYVAEYARARIINQLGLDAYTSGIRVTTTIDSRLQLAANQAVRRNLRDYDLRHGYRGPENTYSELGEKVLNLAPERLPAVLGQILEEIDTVGGLVPALVLKREDDQLRVYASDAGVLTLGPEQIPWDNDEDPLLGLQRGDLIRLARAAEGVWELTQVPEVQGALVSLDPRNGRVRALVGGFDYFASKFNRVLQAERQPGSAFKPFVYSAALEHGFTPATIINDAPVVFHDPALGGAWRPENYSGRFNGPTPVREGLVKSSNLVAIRLVDAMGVGTVRAHASQFGLPAERIPRDLSMALGSGTFTPMEMAEAYAVLANGGYDISPYMIQDIRDDRGELIHLARPATVCDSACQQARQRAEREAAKADGTSAPDAATTDEALPSSGARAAVDATPDPRDEPLPAAPRVISSANAYIVADMMRDVIRRGTGRRARALGRSDLAGKTGTTNDQRDAWFCGFNASHVAVAWVGFDDIAPLGSRETGGRAALPMWMKYMEPALADQPASWLTQPDQVVNARISPSTGLLASYGEPGAKFELFIDGRLPEAGNGGARRPAATPGGAESGSSDAEQDVLEDLF